MPSTSFIARLVISGLLVAVLWAITEERGAAQSRAQHRKQTQIVVIVGTRPEVIKVAPVVKRLRHLGASVMILNTNQQCEMVTAALQRFSLESVDLPMIASHVYQTGQAGIAAHILLAVHNVLADVQPSVVVVQGDTTTAMIGSIAGFYLNLTVAHVEAGLRTGDFSNPFPEEFHRKVIGVSAAMNFAPTSISRAALLREGVPSSTIWVTGNTVVDALLESLRRPIPIAARELLDRVQNTAPGARLVLVTMHRRESFETHLEDMCEGVTRVLQAIPDAVVLLLLHTNPKVQAVVNNKLRHQHPRLLIVPPLEADIFPFILNASSLILTDSGGVQEEGVSLGKAILVMRDITERPEGVLVGNAVVSGRSSARIEELAVKILSDKSVFERMSTPHFPYGYGNASIIVADVIWSHLHGVNSQFGPDSDSSGSGVDTISSDVIARGTQVVVVLTVYGRNTLDKQLGYVRSQTALQGKRVEVIVFQNGNHVDVSNIVPKWQNKAAWGDLDVLVTFVHSTIETGYYGRFFAPFLADASGDAYWFVMDDDVIFGSRYFANAIRVVDEGSLATRNGRFISGDLPSKIVEDVGASQTGWQHGWQVTWNEDVSYDFGGHIWAGKIKWLRNVWKHAPPTLNQAEDFWLSAVLRMKYDIGTKKPKCADLQHCACSMQEAGEKKTTRAMVGSTTETDGMRTASMGIIAQEYGYKPIHPRKDQHESFAPGRGPFTVKGTVFEECLFFT